ncbi:MAG: c-type cytochrome [Bacteroidetes bacterium]|nr:c-type cytochrome [Bacteroidota bacterium]
MAQSGILLGMVLIFIAVYLALGGKHPFAGAPEISADSLRNYGRELVQHTGKYFGPSGSINKNSNGMNCQNCHLDAGTRPYGNNFLAVASTYPKYRPRSGRVEGVARRINDCFERSLNGKALDTGSLEMQAIAAWVLWVGRDVKNGKIKMQEGIERLPYMNRAASPESGKEIYSQKCQSCHGVEGQGVIAANEYTFPPLWGSQSFNSGAGLYRLSRLAGFIHSNMPLGSSQSNPQLTAEQAWDIAAYISSMPRPAADLSRDWPRLEEKPVDHPFGPFADGFSATQHKFGPFSPIEAAHKK